MKLIVKESFEQGLPRQNGGALKLTKGEYTAEKSEHGITLSVAGAKRSLPKDVADRLVEHGLISFE
jgi:hypothetical protein